MPAEIKAYARPRKLYRYRALTGDKPDKFRKELNAIVQGHIYCPSYDSMNDPMEGSHRESALLKDSVRYHRTIAEVQRAIDTLGIASFSEVMDHEPMWAHYAKNFSGICVEYNVKRLLDNLGDENELVRMTYSENAPMLYRDRETAENRARMILSCKSVRWASEREWRLIRPDIGPSPYSSKTAVTSVYLGSRISAEHEATVRSELRPLKIPVRKMEVDTYAIAFEAKRRLTVKRPTRKS
ncbi:DUF2971 domain-containing protein [Rhizobium leguminosarum bv. viciae]|uniref:DUF2971 domain-containing protein n=1 Tax=Rhizobium leguminosarum TaxID=384 RepID=UPI00103D5AE9|nr:DUF2971 domain-containing protein [Rhizobium leguminosarum]TCA17384.1 DUF2971 domain-containing protein [Rhizobium leguminosarum bv. viciae]